MINLSKLQQELRWGEYKLKIASMGIRDPRPHFPGLLSYKEGLFLAQRARQLPPKAVIVEIGCFRGLSTAYLLEGSKKNKAFLYSIDPFDTYLQEQQQDGTNPTLAVRKASRDDVNLCLRVFGHDQFELIQGFSHEVVKTWSKPIDLLWIDGNHEYQAVKQDYEQWTPFIKIGGCIAFHDANKLDEKPGWSDYGWEGPTRFTREALVPPKWKTMRAVDSLIAAYKK